MTASESRPRTPWGFGVFTLSMISLLIGLGVWQLQRRVEKHALISALTERLAAAPVPLPPPSEWSGLTAAKDEFRRVSLTATYARLPDAMVYSAGSAVRGASAAARAAVIDLAIADAGTDGNYGSYNLVSWDKWGFADPPIVIDEVDVAVTDSAVRDLDLNIIRL